MVAHSCPVFVRYLELGIVSRSRRMVIFVAAVGCLAALAGVLAVSAFAWGEDDYCTNCTLPSSGVPAVSAAHHTSFYFNEVCTGCIPGGGSYWQAVYFYSD